MSKRKILAALKRKNVAVERVEYVRGCPTPSGYANGWDIEMTDEMIDKLFSAGFKRCERFNELDTTEEVIDWVGSMPTLDT